MWRTPEGTRILSTAEAHLFVAGVLLLQEWTEDSLDVADNELKLPSGVPLFDALEPEAKYIALATVTKGLINRKIKDKKLEPWHEATICAVYEAIKTGVQVEIDIDHSKELRQLIADAYLDSNKSGEYDTIISMDDPCAEWHSRIKSLAAKVVFNAETKKTNSSPHISSKAFNNAERYLRSLRDDKGKG